MPTMPGFDEACELVHGRGLTAHVGVHLVLTKGRPLTEPIRRELRLCNEDGLFRDWRGSLRLSRLTAAEERAIVGEITAQIDRVRAARLPVTHADSHQGWHTAAPLHQPFLRAVKDRGIVWVRPVAAGGGPRKALATLFRFRVRRAGLRTLELLFDVQDYIRLAANGAPPWPAAGNFEVMTHPGLDGHGTLVDVLARQQLADLIARVPRHDEATSYIGRRLAVRAGR
jgi:predicted glycoside hydrolase/deacetylase ChbG (UPF0249 family)